MGRVITLFSGHLVDQMSNGFCFVMDALIHSCCRAAKILETPSYEGVLLVPATPRILKPPQVGVCLIDFDCPLGSTGRGA